MLNLRKAKKYEFIKRLLPFFTALLLITVVYSISFLFQTVRAASTPTFRYYSNGTQIGATGGQFGSGVYKLNQLPNIKTRYQGDVNLTIGGDQCVIVVTITLTSLNSSTGSIKAFSPYYVSSPGSDTILTCGDEVAAHPDFNNPSISISGSGNEQPVPNPTEPISTKFINLVAYFPKTKSELPNNIKAILKNKVSSKIVATNSLSPSDDKKTSTSTASKSFGGVEPGTYTMCIEPTSIFSISCQDVTKLSGVIGVVTFGANPHADEVGVTVAHSHDQYSSVALTYGPHKINLIEVGTGNIVFNADTDFRDVAANSVMVNVELNAYFDNISEGRYKACIDRTTYCSPEFDKESSSPTYTRINLTEEESSILVKETLGQGSTCNIPGLGWILCPVINLLGSIADSAYSFISTDLLEVKTEVLNSDSGNASTIGAWSIMRNIANVAFVIAFLIIIFSQLTGAGITNYGVKKMLPRIVIAAILVNLSYYICQIAVDISNIVGRSLGVMFDSVEIGGPVATASSGGSIWMNLVGGVIGVAAGAAIVYANLAALIPLLISAAVALVMILFILGARQAIIILLIVISPLAFVAYLLPNTEGLYKKWQKTFLAMLMLYPIIGLVFGVSKFASTILTGVAGNNKVLSIVAAAIGVLPLFVVPGILKKSLDSVGNIGATLNNWGNKLGGVSGKKVSELYDNTAMARGREMRKVSRQNYRNQKFATALNKGGLKSRFARGIRGNLPGWAQTKGTKFTGQSIDRAAIAGAEKAQDTEVAGAELLMRSRANSPGEMISHASKELSSALASGDIIRARAATNILAGSGAPGRDELTSTLASHTFDSDAKIAQRQMSAMNATKGELSKKGLKGSDARLDAFAFSKPEDAMSSIMASRKTYEGLTSTEIIGQSRNTLESAVASGGISKERAMEIVTDPRLASSLSDATREVLTEYATRPSSQNEPKY